MSHFARSIASGTAERMLAAWRRAATRRAAAHAENIGRSRRQDERVGVALLTVVLGGALVFPGAPAAAAADKVDGTTPGKLKISREALPDATMKAGELVTGDGRVLWSRSADDERAMASLTKVMTAVVALEHSSGTDVVTVPASVTSVGESTSFLAPGEKLKMSELLEALLVKSGNDAAVAVAVHVAGSEKAFVKLMNDKAAELGLTHTHFTNSHGLDSKGHHSSASDLGVLARYAMQNPRFRDIVRRPSARIHHASGTSTLESTNIMLRNYAGANGVKTGWTGDAGYSVIVSARRGGEELYAVVLGTKSERARFADAQELLDWGFAHYRQQRLASAGTAVGSAVVTDWLDRTVPGEFSQDTSQAVFDLAGPIDRQVTMAEVRAPVRKGERVGVATFTQRGNVVATVPLVASEAVDAPNLLQRIGIALVRGWRRFTGGSIQASLVSATAVSY